MNSLCLQLAVERTAVTCRAWWSTELLLLLAGKRREDREGDVSFWSLPSCARLCSHNSCSKTQLMGIKRSARQGNWFFLLLKWGRDFPSLHVQIFWLGRANKRFPCWEWRARFNSEELLVIKRPQTAPELLGGTPCSPFQGAFHLLTFREWFPGQGRNWRWAGWELQERRLEMLTPKIPAFAHLLCSISLSDRWS